MPTIFRKSEAAPSERATQQGADLRESVKPARNSLTLLIFVATFSFLALGKITHQDLFLDTGFELPTVRLSIPLRSFFFFAPLILVILHGSVLFQHVALARKCFAFRRTLNILDAKSESFYRTGTPSHFLTWALVGPREDRLLRYVSLLVGWLCLFAIPLSTLIALQIAFLPYHNIVLTYIHRFFIVADVLLIIIFAPSLLVATGSTLSSLTELRIRHALIFWPTATCVVTALAFSWLVVTVPDEKIEELVTSIPGLSWDVQSCSIENDNCMPFKEERKALIPTAMLFESWDGETPLFPRNLMLAGTSIGVENVTPRVARLALTHRDFKYANLNEAELANIDLSFSNLYGATLIAAKLKGSEMYGTNLNRADLFGADLTEAKINSARLMYARLDAILAPNASFENSDFIGAWIKAAYAPGSNFDGARLFGTTITGTFRGATCRDCDARFSWLQALNANDSVLDRIKLSGSRLSGVSLKGASLRHAEMYGLIIGTSASSEVDGKPQGLTETSFLLADFGGAKIWGSQTAESVAFENAELSAIIIGVPSNEEREELLKAIKFAGDLRERKIREDKEGEKLLTELAGSNSIFWALSPPRKFWGALRRRPPPSTSFLARQLAQRACDGIDPDVSRTKNLVHRVLGSRRFAIWDGKKQSVDPAIFWQSLRSCLGNKVDKLEEVEGNDYLIERYKNPVVIR